MNASYSEIIGQDLLKYIQHVKYGDYIVFLIVILCTAKVMCDAHKKRTLPAHELSAFPTFITFFGVLAEMFLCLFIGNMLDAITIGGIEILLLILIVSLILLGVQITVIIVSRLKNIHGKANRRE